MVQLEEAVALADPLPAAALGLGGAPQEGAGRAQVAVRAYWRLTRAAYSGLGLSSPSDSSYQKSLGSRTTEASESISSFWARSTARRIASGPRSGEVGSRATTMPSHSSSSITWRVTWAIVISSVASSSGRSRTS